MPRLDAVSRKGCVGKELEILRHGHIAATDDNGRKCMPIGRIG